MFSNGVYDGGVWYSILLIGFVFVLNISSYISAMSTTFDNILGFSILILALVSGLFRPAVKYLINMSSKLSLGIPGQAWYSKSLRSSEYSVIS